MAEKMKQDTPVYAFSGTATPCLDSVPAFCPVATRVSRQLPPWLPLALNFLDIRRERFLVTRWLWTPSEASEFAATSVQGCELMMPFLVMVAN